MMAVMAATAVPPVLLGRAKEKLSEQLHGKVLYADADMNKADWMTAAGSIVGVAGIGIGVWWADAAAALFIAGGCVDGIQKHARLHHRPDGHPGQDLRRRATLLIGRIEDYLQQLEWVEESGARVRDQGHVLHAEAFVVPRGGHLPPVQALEGQGRLHRPALDDPGHCPGPVSELPEEAGGASERRPSQTFDL